jgi:hypothetical protein
MKISKAFIWGVVYFCNRIGFFRILEKTSFQLKFTPLHIGEFTNARVYKSQFWWKPELFHSFWVAMDLIRYPGVLDKTFGPLGVPRVPNLGLRASNLQLWILSHFDAHTSFYSILTLIVWEKLRLYPHAHHRHIFAPARMGMCEILHIHTFETHCNAAISLCTFAVEQSHFLWFTRLARINILIWGRVGQGQDIKSHIN